jgi:exosortase/archaeosortase family protein
LIMSFFRKNIAHFPLLAWLAMYAGLLFFFKNEYLFQRVNFLIGLAFVPLVFRKISAEKKWRYGWLALLCGSVLFLERGHMAYYFCAGFGMLFLLESGWGRLNNLPAFLLVVMSPVFQYIAEVWSFPIRLKMSELAAIFLSKMGLKAEAAGNVILLDGAEFSVDPACMGLNMLTTSLLLALLILAWFERQQRRTFSFVETGGWLLLTLLLSLFANFNRLLALVLFQVLPTDPMHDVWGLLGMAVYVVLPLFLLVKWRTSSSKLPPVVFEDTLRIAKLGGNLKLPPNLAAVLCPKPGEMRYKNLRTPATSVGANLFRGAILIILIFGGHAPEHEPTFNEGNLTAIYLPGFQNSLTPDGVLKLENDSVLIYLKPPSGFLRASHDPLICWRGSGYEFRQVQRQTVAGLEVYTAILQNENDRLYMAWWYDNGTRQTIEEWEWRWAGLLGEEQGYRLVNVTCADKHMLEENIKVICRGLDQ